MTVVAGVVGNPDVWRRESLCRQMLVDLQVFGRDDQTIQSLGQASFARALFRVVPEDRFDRQPEIVSGRYLSVSDSRIDNRDEVADWLGLPASRAASLSDAGMFAIAWAHSGVAAFERVLGDVAFAAWDDERRTLTLARSAMSLKPLFYCSGPEGVGFASMPHALLSLPWLHKKLDFAEAAAAIAGFPSVDNATMFERVRMVRHGSAVELKDSVERALRLWEPPEPRTGSTLLANAEALRAELDRSVKAQLRRVDGPAACQLSSGRDSTAVAAAASGILAEGGESLIALTGAPSLGEVLIPSNRLVDESELAAEMAILHPNLLHSICRSRPRPIARELREATRVHWRPISHLTAHHWTSEIDEEAKSRGAKILLIGSAGNFSLSPSGPQYLVDVLKEGGAASWLRHAFIAGDGSLSKWRSILSLSLGPFLPEAAFKTLLNAAGRARENSFDLPILRQPYRRIGESRLREIYGDARPPRSRRDFHRLLLLQREPADQMSLALSGLDVRDPTADRRLVELGLSIPAEQFVSPVGASSPVYEAAFGRRIPPKILDNRNRGLQGADWSRLFRRAELGETFAKLALNPLVSELVDLGYVERVLAGWPSDYRAASAVIGDDQGQVLAALAVADFIDLHFPLER